MTNYTFDRDSNNYSDEYQSDKIASDQYAEAARQASLQNQLNFDSNYRKVEFEHAGYEEQNEEILAREEAFRASLAGAGYRSQRSDQDSLDLDELDDMEQTGPYRAGGAVERSDKSKPLQPRRTAGPVSARNRRSQRQRPNPSRDIFSGLLQALFLSFSKRPMQAFHLNLHWGSLGVLALLNILLVAGLNTVVMNKLLKAALGGVGSLVSGTAGFGAGKVFFMSLLSQLATLIAVVLMVLFLTLILGSEKKPFKQYVQTATLSTLPYSFVLFIALIVSFFLPKIGIILAFAGKIHVFIYLYAGFQKGHPTKKNSPFWFFVLLIAVVLVVQYLFVGWTLT
ncbi:MAG: YIP1 family protein [Clostridiaceae bacterium]|nr:YIP1 family protein [Clostridiaceae bacterium]